ncbi:myeloid cell surface antigen CD33-like [Salmo trutta]|uniref:myeloid cell surface antigen CD33-like n=1 Tax=Salmo trutta TaxID=8032 RepID=UPI0011314F38|nr:myeloid cell surface antigen CD33-like [Salmo trutta]
MGKARVAPLKQMTIPHMELAAAVLSVKVDKMLCTELQLKLDDLVFWTDSHSVLKYIANEPQEGSKHRVSLLETDLTKGNCSVIINDIKENDAGQYQFRMIGGPFTDPQKITVTALTQEPSMLTPTLTEGKSATLTCTAPGICSGTPPHITWTWRGTGDNMTELRENTTIQKREALTSVTTTHFSTLTFTPSAKYHGTKVTCLVTFNGSVTTKKTLKLNVTNAKRGPKGLRLQKPFHEPGDGGM